jgi:hypothetical protein
MARAVIQRPFTAEARVPSRGSPCVIRDLQNISGRGFLRVLRFSLVNINSPERHICCSYQDKRAKPGNLEQVGWGSIGQETLLTGFC